MVGKRARSEKKAVVADAAVPVAEQSAEPTAELALKRQKTMQAGRSLARKKLPRGDARYIFHMPVESTVTPALTAMAGAVTNNNIAEITKLISPETIIKESADAVLSALQRAGEASLPALLQAAAIAMSIQPTTVLRIIAKLERGDPISPEARNQLTGLLGVITASTNDDASASMLNAQAEKLRIGRYAAASGDLAMLDDMDRAFSVATLANVKAAVAHAQIETMDSLLCRMPSDSGWKITESFKQACVSGNIESAKHLCLQHNAKLVKSYVQLAVDADKCDFLDYLLNEFTRAGINFPTVQARALSADMKKLIAKRSLIVERLDDSYITDDNDDEAEEGEDVE